MHNNGEVVKFLYNAGVIKFGSFTLKSGRIAPYFINTGSIIGNNDLKLMGKAYADRIVTSGVKFDTLFGPAYKGIPIAVSTAIALDTEHKLATDYCFDRKEAKDHGEGGKIVGHEIKDGDRILIVEDVITAGTAMREVVPLILAQAKVEIVGLVVLVDRMEKTASGKSAVRDVEEEFGFKVYPIITINDIIEAIRDGVIPGMEYLDEILRYRETYGAVGD
jgi:orotate phosphoribosyltransferase